MCPPERIHQQLVLYASQIAKIPPQSPPQPLAPRSNMIKEPEPLVHGGNGSDHAHFDPSAPPPFKIAEIRAAIPKHCWEKNTWRSLSYVLMDVFVVTTLLALAIGFNSWFFWPLYWLAQGTMFWALFVLGHDW